MSDLTNSSSLNSWFTPVDTTVANAILESTATYTYEKSPFRTCFTGKNPFFSWSSPTAVAANGATPPPEITEPIIALRGYILHAGARFSLYDTNASKQICGSVSSILTYDANQNPINNTNSYCIPGVPYGPEGYSEVGNPVVVNPLVENFQIKGSRGQMCEECVLAGNHTHTYIAEKGKDAGKEVIDKCGASNQLQFVVFEFGIVEQSEEGKSEVVWYKPNEYVNRKNVAVIPGPFVLSLNIGRGAATKKIGAKFQIVTEPQSPVPGDVMTWVSYYQHLQNPNDRKVNIVKLQDKTLFNCEYASLPTTLTEVWAGSATNDFKNEMIACWPVFKDLQLETQSQMAEAISLAFGIYANEKSKKGSTVVTPTAAALPATTTAQPATTTAQLESGEEIDVSIAEPTPAATTPVTPTVAPAAAPPTVDLTNVFARKK